MWFEQDRVLSCCRFYVSLRPWWIKDRFVWQKLSRLQGSLCRSSIGNVVTSGLEQFRTNALSIGPVLPSVLLRLFCTQADQLMSLLHVSTVWSRVKSAQRSALQKQLQKV